MWARRKVSAVLKPGLVSRHQAKPADPEKNGPQPGLFQRYLWFPGWMGYPEAFSVHHFLAFWMLFHSSPSILTFKYTALKQLENLLWREWHRLGASVLGFYYIYITYVFPILAAYSKPISIKSFKVHTPPAVKTQPMYFGQNSLNLVGYKEECL